jgi:hypothetical protein
VRQIGASPAEKQQNMMLFDSGFPADHSTTTVTATSHTSGFEDHKSLVEIQGKAIDSNPVFSAERSDLR